MFVLFYTVKLCIFVYLWLPLWQTYESIECMYVPNFHIACIWYLGVCSLFFILKHYNPLSLAFTVFTTDAHSVLSKSPSSSAFYTLVPEVHFNFNHPPWCGSSFFSPLAWYAFQYLVYCLSSFLLIICPSYFNSNILVTVIISQNLHLL